MTKTTESYQRGTNPRIDKLLDLSAKLGLERDVLQTTNHALAATSTYSHIYSESVEKVLYRHHPRMQEDSAFARTLLLAGFTLPYKHGVQFRGMINALTAMQPIELLDAFNTNPLTRANVILAYRNLTMPRTGEGYLLEENIPDCSLAISHPVLRLKASGYYVDQFSKILATTTVRKLREQYNNDIFVDLALIEFAKKFVYGEVDAHREIASSNPTSLTHKIVHEHIYTTFANAAPDIAFSATLPHAKEAHEQLFAATEHDASPTPSYYHEAVKSFIGKSRKTAHTHTEPVKTKETRRLEDLAVA